MVDRYSAQRIGTRCGLIVTGALIGVVAAIAQADVPLAALDRDGRPPVPRVVVADVCAWPNLTVLPDGAIAAVIFNKPIHGRLPGEIDCWVSEDAGATWERRTSPVLHEPGSMSNRMNHAAGLAGNGDLLVLCSGWTLIEKPVPAHNSTLDVDKELQAVACRSSDGGRTWAVTDSVFPEASPDGNVLVPYGDIVADADGTLRVAAYATIDRTKNVRRSYVLESDDDGKTWKNPVAIDVENSLNETFIHRAADGRWFAIARGAQLWQYESTDSAATWSRVAAVTERNELPGHLLALRDGGLLLCAGRRVKGDEAVIAKLSRDGGQTWSPSARLVRFYGFDGGYPSSVQLSDGRVLTAYYAQKTDDHDGYHMGVVIWDPAATFANHP